MKKKSMYLRIKESEKEQLRKAHMRINNKLLENQIKTVGDSDILHECLRLSLDRIKVDNLGRFYIDQ